MRNTMGGVDGSTIRLLDTLVLFWLVLWVVVGAWTAVTIWRVSDIGDTVTSSGHALESSGVALGKFSAVPVVGDDVEVVGADVLSTGSDVAERGQEVKGELRQLALLLGISIVVIPTTPIVGLYLPLRWNRQRDISAVRDALSAHVDDRGLDRHLAERAMAHLSFMTIHKLSTDPWRDLAEGNTRGLADAELRRLGLERQRS